MEGRLALLMQIEPYVGRYYSTEYVRRQILRQRDQEIVEIDNQIEAEIAAGVLPDPNQQMLELEQGAMDPMMQQQGMEQGGAEQQAVPTPAPQPQKAPKEPGPNEGEI